MGSGPMIIANGFSATSNNFGDGMVFAYDCVILSLKLPYCGLELGRSFEVDCFC